MQIKSINMCPIYRQSFGAKKIETGKIRQETHPTQKTFGNNDAATGSFSKTIPARANTVNTLIKPINTTNTSGNIDSLAQNVQRQANEFQLNYVIANKTMSCLIKDIQKQADKIAHYAQRLTDEAVELFSQGNQTLSDGRVIRIVSKDDSTKTMEEYDAEGNLSRRSTFKNGSLINIQEGPEEMPDGTKRTAREICFINGQISKYQENIEKTPDGAWKVGKVIGFSNKKVNCYQENVEQLADGTFKKMIGIMLIGGKPLFYQEGVFEFTDGTRTIAKEISYKDGRIERYTEEYSTPAEGVQRKAKEILYDSRGNATSCKLGFERFASKYLNVAQEILLKDGKLRRYTQGYTMLGRSSWSSKKIMDFSNGKPIKYQENHDKKTGRKTYEMTGSGWQEVTQ